MNLPIFVLLNCLIFYSSMCLPAELSHSNQSPQSKLINQIDNNSYKLRLTREIPPKITQTNKGEQHQTNRIAAYEETAVDVSKQDSNEKVMGKPRLQDTFFKTIPPMVTYQYTSPEVKNQQLAEMQKLLELAARKGSTNDYTEWTNRIKAREKVQALFGPKLPKTKALSTKDTEYTVQVVPLPPNSKPNPLTYNPVTGQDLYGCSTPPRTLYSKFQIIVTKTKNDSKPIPQVAAKNILNQPFSFTRVNQAGQLKLLGAKPKSPPIILGQKESAKGAKNITGDADVTRRIIPKK